MVPDERSRPRKRSTFLMSENMRRYVLTLDHLAVRVASGVFPYVAWERVCEVYCEGGVRERL